MKIIFNIFIKINSLLLQTVHRKLHTAFCLLKNCILPTERLHTAFCLLKNCILPTERLPTAYCILHTASRLLPTAKLPTAYCKTAYSLLLFCLLLTTNYQLAQAQRFPVQVNQTITPPYNTKISSYATATDVKLRLFLTLNDINVSNRQVRLKLKIQGQGVNIQSREFISGAAPLFLNGGTQQQFTNIDLAPYFQLRNLVGINPQQYGRPLPDGSYTMCWEVYDALTNQLISNPNMGCTSMFLVLNDPPFLNLPNRGDQIAEQEPTNLMFQWTPRHVNATNVSYEFELREIWDNQIDPQAGFLASPPLHSETTRATTFLYNNTKPALLPDKTYAWRIRAKSTTGLSENSVFRNNGYSEIFYFTVTKDCDAPKFALSEAKNPNTVKITWQGYFEHNKYHVQYRKASPNPSQGGEIEAEQYEWFEVYTQNEQAQISNLEAGETYEFRVGGTCNALTQLEQFYTYTSINTFTMPTADESVSYSCGIVPEINITNTTPLENIGVNETFTAGDFPVTIKQIQGGNGVYSGTGFIVVPYLADTKIAVEFSGIKINTDYQLFDGIIQTTYDADWGGVDDVDEIIEEVFGDNDDSDIVDGDSGSDGSDSDTGSTSEDNTGNTDPNTGGIANTDNSGNNDSNTTDTNTGNTNTDSSSGSVTSNTGINDSSPSNNSSNTGDTEVVIVHNNKSYKNGDVIEIPYTRNLSNQIFELINIEEDTRVDWSTHADMSTVSATSFAGEGSKLTYRRIKDDIDFALQAQYYAPASNYPDGDSKKIRLHIKVIRPEFDLVELYAKHAERRIAKSGEKLYVIDVKDDGNTKKNIDYGIKITPKISKNTIYPSSIKWYDDGPGTVGAVRKEGEKNYNRSVSEKLADDNGIYTTTVTAGSPNLLEKSVDVQWVDENLEVISYANKINKLMEVFGVVNEVSDKISTVAPCGITFAKDLNRSIKFQWSDYNEEDKSSRHARKVDKFEFIASVDNLVKLKCGKKLAISVFGYGLDLGEIYAQLAAGVNASIINADYYLYEDNSYIKNKTYGTGGLKVTGEVGLTVGGGLKDDDGSLIVGLVGGGKVSITGGGRLEYPLEGDKQKLGIIFYIDPLLYTFTAEAKLGSYLSKSFEYKGTLIDIRERKEITIILD